MNFNINWSSIKDGFKGFEKLAYDYVADVLPNKEWQKTQETRDGNKDACAVFMGYQPIGTESTQWWMEAKYSEKTKNITRYRLDNTLVSAILEKNVSKIIFVTNISIKPKTIMDIRDALSTAIHCNDVRFATRYTLEWWLLNRPDIYKKYFKEEYAKNLTFPLFLIDEAEFFSYSKKYTFQFCPCDHLQSGEKYFAYFTIFSPVSQKLHISVGEPYKEKIHVSSKLLEVDEGVNECKIIFEILPELSDFTISGNIFEVAELPIISKTTVEVLKRGASHLKISSQENVYTELKQALDVFQNIAQTNFHYIRGESGTGKSYIIEQFINSEFFRNSFIYWDTFTESATRNCKKLLNLILFVLFPYIDPETIDDRYLSSISKHYISKALIDLVAEKNDSESLYQGFANLDYEQLFPNEIGKEKRYIIVDDVQNLEEKFSKSFNKVLKIIYDRNFPIFIIIIGQNFYYESACFHKFKKEVCTYEHICSLSTKDILYNLNQKTNFSFKLDDVTDILFPNIMDIFFFTKYVSEHEGIIDSLEDFQFLYRSYTNNAIGEKYVLNKFKNLFQADSVEKDICHSVYWSLNGCRFDMGKDYLKIAIGKLIENHLIKLDGNNWLIPYHDKYKRLYRRRFQEYIPTIVPEFQDKFEKIRFTVLFEKDIAKLEEVYECLESLRKQSSFFSILDILEILFEEHNHIQITLRFGPALYFKIFYLYTIAATNCSNHITGKQGFYQLYSESKKYTDLDIKCIWIKSAWELCNSCYEHLEFKDALSYAEEIKENVLLLEMTEIKNAHDKFEEYYSAMVIKNLIDSEKNTADCYTNYISLNQAIGKTPFRIRFFSHQIRFIQTLYMRETTKSLTLLKQCMDKVLEEFDENNKYYLWCGFDYNFLKFIISGEISCFSEMYNFLKSLKKDFFNDYRKRLLGVAGLFFCKGLKDKGNEIIFENLAIDREMRPRFQGFYNTLIAVYNLFYSNNKETAIKLLRKSLKTFDGLEEYQKIIVHNIKVIETAEITKIQLKFCVDNDLSDTSSFYLDPRSCW